MTDYGLTHLLAIDKHAVGGFFRVFGMMQFVEVDKCEPSRMTSHSERENEAKDK